MLNPLSRIQISFPSRTTFRYQYDFDAAGPEHLCRVFVKKFALASNPCFLTIPPALESDKSSVVMAIYGEGFRLAFASPGDEAWTDVESPIGCYDDIMFFNGSFYAVDTDGMLRICVITTTPPKTVDIAMSPGWC
ncbi:hypothetical protein IFM89_032677 [Coptis chinensis]|uniref:KIB1-4 beta-propeller domain-containing protein n=1 Tax=Coptis chinensis TaxID=261450 RepID=A0A835II23_9MAGN|nr:hypothetical protein IFM89_032677 [Coptis chinensis]